MDLGLRNKVIVVSGGASGIGEAISRAALAEGARVAILTRMTEAAAAFRRWAEKASQDCMFVELELREEAQCKSATEQIIEHYGSIDALVNNAGTNDRIGLERGTPRAFMDGLHENLLHYYSLAHYALPFLKASGGSIVNISSKVALTGQGGTSSYAAAKGAQLALTREWAAELLPYNIRVNAVLPAEVMTPLYRRWLEATRDPEANLHKIASKVPLGRRLTHAEEIASAVLFLLSPTQSAHTTAQHIIVDGGYVHLDRALT